MVRSSPRTPRGTGVVAMVAGAASAAAGLLLLGFPGPPGGRPDLAVTGPAETLAAAALVVVPVLLLVAAAGRTRHSDGAGDRLVAPGPHPDGRHRRAGQLLDPVHVAAGGGGQLLEGAAPGDVLKPAR
jgi:hypothetical protein